jgi:hypothetical protein
MAQLISWRLRGYPSQEDAYQTLLNNGYGCGTATPSQCVLSAIFKGYFLEIGPTVIHAVFFALALSVALWIKLKRRQFIFCAVFATITLTITMSYGPLYPYFNGTLGVRFAFIRANDSYSL